MRRSDGSPEARHKFHGALKHETPSGCMGLSAQMPKEVYETFFNLLSSEEKTIQEWITTQIVEKLLTSGVKLSWIENQYRRLRKEYWLYGKRKKS